ncbi:MAG TPA: orotate phosphoribosyltransferase [Bacillota bacterium]|jgi:orotate phosphoribosyltransferase|nr:orotate phosphoribosyltransferase [Bacillota bacterium]HPU75908.1 orotate phosphoribosyltransferase [Bacillota bacterium]
MTITEPDVLLTTDEALDIFTSSGALLRGHFIFTSGRHSDVYMQCAQVLRYPEHTEKLAKHLASHFRSDAIDIVIGPALGGIVVAYEVARQLGAVALFTEREDDRMVLRRSFSITPGQRVLVVEDVITTGGSVREVMEVVREHQGHVAGVGVLIDRSNGAIDFGVKQTAVLSMEIPSWEADACPLCREGKLPAVKPGSRPGR